MRHRIAFKKDHLRHGEIDLQLIVPHTFTHQESVDIVRAILRIDPEEYEGFHLSAILRPVVQSESWAEFARGGRFTA